MNYLEILACKWLIKRIREGWGGGCADYHKDCGNCQSLDCIKFLERNIEILK